MEFPFKEAPNTACLVCKHVLDKKSPILYVSHDEDDGIWQFLCGCEHKEEDARIVSLLEIFMLDPSVGKLVDMHCGCNAFRKSEKEDFDF